MHARAHTNTHDNSASTFTMHYISLLFCFRRIPRNTRTCVDATKSPSALCSSLVQPSIICEIIRFSAAWHIMPQTCGYNRKEQFLETTQRSYPLSSWREFSCARWPSHLPGSASGHVGEFCLATETFIRWNHQTSVVSVHVVFSLKEPHTFTEITCAEKDNCQP